SFTYLATYEIHTLSLHDALPIYKGRNQVAHTFEVDRKLVDEMVRLHSEDYKDFKMANDRERITGLRQVCAFICGMTIGFMQGCLDRKSTRLNSSHGSISYAVFCL